MFTVEAARCHPMADCRIERAAALLRHLQCEPHGFEENRARGDWHADPCRQLHQLTLPVEPRTALFDLVKPSESAIHGGAGASINRGADDLNRDQRSHHSFGADRHAHFTPHLALLRASKTAQ